MKSALRELRALGQSVWLDDLRRQYVQDGTLARLVHEDGISGVTTNPAIFERAIRESVFYDASIETYAREGDDAEHIYERLVVDDVQHAADLLRPRYEESETIDGYVSLEVSPHLANETEPTIAEAKRLWALVARPNLMIKVPGTQAGLPAIRALIAEGINVNVTLLFSVARYREVIEAYWTGLEARAAAEHSIDRVASVASFFVSRIDTAVDTELRESTTKESASLRGMVAIAAAASAYQVYLDTLSEPRWQALVALRAQRQRLLWASTGTKNSDDSDVKYVEALIGRDTVTTLPMQTLVAYRDHGDPRPRLRETLDQADAIRCQLAVLGVDIEAVAYALERAGVQKFNEAYDRLIERIDQRSQTSVEDASEAGS